MPAMARIETGRCENLSLPGNGGLMNVPGFTRAAAVMPGFSPLRSEAEIRPWRRLNDCGLIRSFRTPPGTR